MKLFLTTIALSFCLATAAYAQDADDTFEVEETTAGEAVSADKGIDKKSAKDVKAFIDQHIAHANKKDIDAYMGDFTPNLGKRLTPIKAFTERTMALKDLKLELLATEIAAATKQTATVHTRQRASYTLDDGQKVIDDVILTYKLHKTNAKWHILSTERRRLTTP